LVHGIKVGTQREVAVNCLTWPIILAMLGAYGLRNLLEHAGALERRLGQHAPDEPLGSSADDVFLRSRNWARWPLGIPLPNYGAVRAWARVWSRAMRHR
jgi:hypothetical protein